MLKNIKLPIFILLGLFFLSIFINNCISHHGIESCLASCRNQYKHCRKKNRDSLTKLEQCERDYEKCKSTCMTQKRQKAITNEHLKNRGYDRGNKY